MKLIIIITFLAILLVIGVLKAWSSVWKRLNSYNQQLLKRTWEHEKFLMQIYEDCPPEIQSKIESYLNAVKPLE